MYNGTRHPLARGRLHAGDNRLAGEVALELEDVLREAVCRRRVAAQRAHCRLVGARCASQPEVDPAGMESLKRPELLGDSERGMVGQHDPSGAEADGAE